MSKWPDQLNIDSHALRDRLSEDRGDRVALRLDDRDVTYSEVDRVASSFASLLRHGADAHGLEGLGKDLHANAFVAGNSDDEMVAFLQVGRTPDDPANDTGVLMPPRGGNPALTDDDLLDVVAYLRTLE